MKKVLFFIPSMCGGAERQAIIISRCLPDDEFTVCYYLIGEENQLEKFLPKGRKAVYRKVPKYTYHLLSYMRKVICKEKPDIVYGTVMAVNWRLVIAAMFTRCKIVLRNEHYIYRRSRMQKLRLALTYPFADYVIAQTEEMTDGLVKTLRLRKDLVHTVANAIDKQNIDQCVLAPSPYSDTNHIRFVAVGRFQPVKGFDLLVRAFKIVKDKVDNAELYIVGEHYGKNEVYREVMDYVQTNGLEGCVYCTGFKDNPYVYVKHADCFVLSSRSEGLPNVMIEALYLGTPVAAMKCVPVIERIVEDGKTGFLAANGNVEELADAMLKAYRLGRITNTYVPHTEEIYYQIFKNL